MTEASVRTNEGKARRSKGVEKLPSEAELTAFYRDCTKKASAETCKAYVNYLRKPLDPENKQSVLAWKKYFKWKGDIEAWKSIKTKKSGVDLRVPSEAEVGEWLSKVRGTKVEAVFRLLLEGGPRLTEAVKVLAGYDPKSDACDGQICVYTLNWSRGPKRAFYVFHVSRLQGQSITYNYAKKLLHRLGIEPKLVRKFVATKMLELNVPAEVVDFVQGRTPSQILTKHYLDLLALAKKYYPVYASYLLKTFYNG